MMRFITILALGLTATALPLEDNPRFFTNGHAGFQFFHASAKKENAKISAYVEKNNSDYDEEFADSEQTEVHVKIPYEEIKRHKVPKNTTKMNVFDRLKNLNKFKKINHTKIEEPPPTTQLPNLPQTTEIYDEKENLAIEESNNRKFFNASNEIVNLNFKPEKHEHKNLVKIKILESKPENRGYLNVLNEFGSNDKNLNKKRENGPNVTTSNLAKVLRTKSNTKIFLVQKKKHEYEKVAEEEELGSKIILKTQILDIEPTSESTGTEEAITEATTIISDNNKVDEATTIPLEEETITTMVTIRSINQSNTEVPAVTTKKIAEVTTQTEEPTLETTIKPAKYNRVYHYDPKRSRLKEQPKKPVGDIFKPRRTFKTVPRKTYQVTTKRPMITRNFTRTHLLKMKHSNTTRLKLVPTMKPRNFTKPSFLYTRKPGDTFMHLHRRMMNVTEAPGPTTEVTVKRDQRHITRRPMFRKMHLIIYT